MRRILAVALLVCLSAPFAGARDFLVEFVKENYRETKLGYTDIPQIYHSIQVKTPAGEKLLILTGENNNYRKWLREYISENNRFLVQVSEENNHQFIGARAFEINVSQIHPFQIHSMASKNSKKDPSRDGIAVLEGKHILVVDNNLKRTRLMAQVIRRLGFKATVMRDSNQAFNTFRVQPEKFKMIIANHGVTGLGSKSFVDQVVSMDNRIPILFETGYRNRVALNKSLEHFSGRESVRVTPMALKDLQNTIKSLVDNNA
ncbi:MAG: response regulator [Desulfobacterales bacterium]|nr:response regulator [Desulfobacterales bacterium]